LGDYALLRSLDEDDEVTRKIVEAFDAVKRSSFLVHSEGRPSTGGKILLKESYVLRPGSTVNIKYPEDAEDAKNGPQIAATLVLSPELKCDRALKCIMKGGVGSRKFDLEVRCSDPKCFDTKDPFWVIAFGK